MEENPRSKARRVLTNYDATIVLSQENMQEMVMFKGRRLSGEKFKGCILRHISKLTPVLPSDYNNWSSTIILFKESTHCISVHALDCATGSLYYVVSKKQSDDLGYTAGDFKIYFVANSKVSVYDIRCGSWVEDFPQMNCPKNAPFAFFVSQKLYVLSGGICGSSGICKGGKESESEGESEVGMGTESEGGMESESEGGMESESEGGMESESEGGMESESQVGMESESKGGMKTESERSHFEMFDTNNSSQGWVRLPEPSFVGRGELIASDFAMIIDSEEKVYLRLLKFSLHDCMTDLYCFDVSTNKWHTFRLFKDCPPGDVVTAFVDEVRDLTCFAGNLLVAPWSDGCAIVEGYLYRFKICEYEEGVLENRKGYGDGVLRANLVIRDLNHSIEVQSNAIECDFVDDIHCLGCSAIEGKWEVDLTDVVHPDVIMDNYAVSNLVFVCKSGSWLRFSLVVKYECMRSQHDHISTCVFDVMQVGTESFTVKSVFRSPATCVMYERGAIACKKLCGLK